MRQRTAQRKEVIGDNIAADVWEDVIRTESFVRDWTLVNSA